jgi:23S rRNA (guanine745-N1)-methyltransferase
VNNVIWACPVCQAPLLKTARTWRCEQGHCFDCAKEGYVNLLLANQKRSSDPGDTKEMMVNRRAFLDAGFYQPLSDALNGVLADLKPTSLLDSGCGEGYYLRRYVESDLHQAEVFGLDISKDAVRMASKSNSNMEFAVASSFHLPVLDQSLNVLLRVFAPGDLDEVARVLKPGGAFVLVVPGPQHLFSLKQALYQEPQLHELPDVPAGWVCEREECVSFDLALKNSESVQRLLAMTPFVWKGNREAKLALEKAEHFSSQADFRIRVYQKIPTAGDACD